jgi:hypothetical protein
MLARRITGLALLSLTAISQDKIPEAPISRFPALPYWYQKGFARQRLYGSATLTLRCEIEEYVDDSPLLGGRAIGSRRFGQGTPRGGPCWRSIFAVGKTYIMEHYRRYRGPKPPVIDHEGIDVGLCDKASIVSYLYQNQWLTLAGAD